MPERLLRERGHEVRQAKDEFDEYTDDAALLEWCATNGVVLVTNNAKDFEPLASKRAHAGILLYYDQSLPETDPEGLIRFAVGSYRSTAARWAVEAVTVYSKQYQSLASSIAADSASSAWVALFRFTAARSPSKTWRSTRTKESSLPHGAA